MTSGHNSWDLRFCGDIRTPEDVACSFIHDGELHYGFADSTVRVFPDKHFFSSRNIDGIHTFTSYDGEEYTGYWSGRTSKLSDLDEYEKSYKRCESSLESLPGFLTTGTSFDGNAYIGDSSGTIWNISVAGSLTTLPQFPLTPQEPRSSTTWLGVGYVSCFASSDRRLYSGSRDGRIRCWDTDLQCVWISEPCCNFDTTDPFIITRLALCAMWLCSASSNHVIRIWNDSGQCVREIDGHCVSIRGLVQFDGGLYSVSTDSTIRRWDVASGTCEFTVNHGPCPLTAVCMFDEYIIIGDMLGSVHRLDLRGKCLQKIFRTSDFGNFARIVSLLAAGGYMYTNAVEHVIRRWQFVSVRSLLNICLSNIRGYRHRFTRLQLARLPEDLLVYMPDLVDSNDVDEMESKR